MVTYSHANLKGMAWASRFIVLLLRGTPRALRAGCPAALFVELFARLRSTRKTTLPLMCRNKILRSQRITRISGIQPHILFYFRDSSLAVISSN